MPATPFSARGAVDLGALATARQNQQRAAEAMAHAPEGVVIAATADTFQADVIDRSLSVPVVLDMRSSRSDASALLSPVLERLAAEYGGRFVLAKVDVDAQPQIAAAFQVKAIPSAFAVIAGQPVPLFEGAYPEAQVRQILDELLRVAAEQGLTGTVTDGEAAAAADDEPAEAPLDPRFEAAYEAIEAGDWAGAEQAYRTVLAASPADVDAAAGLALVGLYSRTDGAEEPTRTDGVEEPTATDDASTLLAADFAALRSDWPTAFRLATDVVRRTAGEEREAARARMLDYFVMAADDPAVPAARTALASALF